MCGALCFLQQRPSDLPTSTRVQLTARVDFQSGANFGGAAISHFFSRFVLWKKLPGSLCASVLCGRHKKVVLSGSVGRTYISFIRISSSLQLGRLAWREEFQGAIRPAQ